MAKTSTNAAVRSMLTACRAGDPDAKLANYTVSTEGKTLIRLRRAGGRRLAVADDCGADAAGATVWCGPRPRRLDGSDNRRADALERAARRAAHGHAFRR